MLVTAIGWTVLVLIIRRAIDSSAVSRKLDLLTEELRTLRRELKARDAQQAADITRGHHVDSSV